MKKDHAVVIGGSIAGLMAARALSRHFTSVTILERDALRENGAPRKGAPQGNHVHVLLTSGMQALEQYFPGLLAEMRAGGVDPIAWSEEMRWYQHGSWKTRVPCGITFYPQSRVSLEERIRARVRNISAISIRDESSVQGLLYDASRETVTGVRVSQDGREFDLAADLVVDAAGRGSRILKWLDELGFQAPPKETLPIDLVYVSRMYRKTAKARDWKGLAAHPLPDLPRGGILLPIDAERWIVTLFGYGDGNQPSTEPDAFLRFTKDLPAPDIYETLLDATPLSEPLKFIYPQEVRQRFDKLEHFPTGLLLIGDAMCSVDPVFGQGMTLSCKEAQALDKLLAAQGNQLDFKSLRKQYFSACQQIITVPWLITQSEALRFEHTQGDRNLVIRLLQWYTGHVFALSAQHVDVYRAFLDVMHLLSGPEAMFRPSVLGKVLIRAIFGPRERPAVSLAPAQKAAEAQ